MTPAGGTPPLRWNISEQLMRRSLTATPTSHVTNPVSGLPSKLNWLPTVKEIRDACEEGLRVLTRADRWEAQARKQIAERETLAIENHRPRKTYEQLCEECRAVGIMIGPKGRTAVDVGDVRTKWGISQEQWNAIPNAK